MHTLTAVNDRTENVINVNLIYTDLLINCNAVQPTVTCYPRDKCTKTTRTWTGCR